jgi:hypothetical protein
VGGKHKDNPGTSDAAAATASADGWRRYARRHNPVRVDVPPDMAVLRHARVYKRNKHYYAEVHDPAQKTNVRSRRALTLLEAIADAVELDRLVAEERSTGRRARFTHRDLVAAYTDDLARRAEAAELASGTTRRYATALAHYLAFSAEAEIVARYPHATGVDKGFARAFAARLDAIAISPNGHQNAKKRRMRGQAFVLDTVRAMYEWARDPERGNLLPASFKNPFLGLSRRLRADRGTPLREPDVTTEMAVEFVAACDSYHLRLFAPVILYGLRPGELCFLFREYVTDRFLRVPCNPALLYTTKGRISKELPLFGPVGGILLSDGDEGPSGLLYRQRQSVEGSVPPPVWAVSLDSLVTEFERRCVEAGQPGRAERLNLRDQVMKEAGAVTYDDIQADFARIARRLKWPGEATLKDFRHLFSTTMENAGLPVFYRRFLMGHSLGRSAIVNYTHLNKLRELFEDAVRREWPDLLDAVEDKARELGLVADNGHRGPRIHQLRLVKGASAAPGGA